MKYTYLFLCALLMGLCSFAQAERDSDQSDGVVQQAEITPENEIDGLQLFPNPVTEGTLHITTSRNAQKFIILYDVLGKVV